LIPISPSAAAEPLLSVQQLQSDLGVIEHVIYRDHPDIRHGGTFEPNPPNSPLSRSSNDA
jgi:hypothetical protein